VQAKVPRTTSLSVHSRVMEARSPPFCDSSNCLLVCCMLTDETICSTHPAIDCNIVQIPQKSLRPGHCKDTQLDFNVLLPASNHTVNRRNDWRKRNLNNIRNLAKSRSKAARSRRARQKFTKMRRLGGDREVFPWQKLLCVLGSRNATSFSGF
jgi:hypothetical protein